jgi:hypothetical protein
MAGSVLSGVLSVAEDVPTTREASFQPVQDGVDRQS